MADSWFTSLGSRMVRMFPSVTLTGVAHERLQGVSGRLVEIVANNDAYWVKVQLPISRQAELIYVICGLEHETRMRILGAILAGSETTGTATTPAVLDGRAQRHPVYQLGHFTISFDLPGAVSLAIRHNKLCDDGTFEIFLLKAPPQDEATEPAPSEEEATPAPNQTAEEAAAAPTSSA